MTKGFTTQQLERDSSCYRGTGGNSEGNRCSGFLPAFRDNATGAVFPSLFADGRPAPVHTLDGLPDELVIQRESNGRVVAVRDSVVAGFVRDGRFFTREEAACAVAENQGSSNSTPEPYRCANAHPAW